MGEMILITGANGFVGRAAVQAARSKEIEVTAVYRSTPSPEWASDPGITPLQADLSNPDCVPMLATAARTCGATIHAAALLGGDSAHLEHDTRRATEILLSALPKDMRLVLVSSIAVYDTLKLAPGDILTEDSPLETSDTAHDGYAKAKLQQEELCQASGLATWILRPGAVYGPGRSWHALMGFWASKLHVQISSDGQLPLVHVDHLADTLIQAARTDSNGAPAVNVIDDDLPTRARFLKAHRNSAGWPHLTISISFKIWLLLARLLKPVSSKLPGLFQEPVLRARLMPLSYPNDALRAALGGADRAPFEQMLAQSVEQPK